MTIPLCHSWWKLVKLGLLLLYLGSTGSLCISPLLSLIFITLKVLITLTRQHRLSNDHLITFLILLIGGCGPGHREKSEEYLLVVRVLTGSTFGVKYAHMGEGGNIK